MTRFLAAVVTFAALGVEAFADRGAAGASGHERGLRGTSEVLLCNSIGCPAGFTPIDNAWEVACTDNECEVSQCCETFCAFYACPGPFVPIDDARSVRCTDDVCTTEQCCTDVDDHEYRRQRKLSDDTLYCNSIGCPAGFTPIDNAWEVACTGDECEVSQCCETFCAFYACPGPFIPIDDARSVRCTDDVCTTEQCCTDVDDHEYRRQRKLSDDTLYCNSIGCPAGFTPIDNAWEVACTGDECEVSQCCETFCAFYACPGPFIPIDDARSVRCTDDVCTTEQCCTDVDDHEYRRHRKLSDDTLYCNSIGCPAGFTPIDNAWEVACTGDECEVSQCCETFCAFYACPGPFIPIDDARSVRCTDDVCTTEQCCTDVDDHEYRRQRKLSDDTLYCNSIGCPAGFTPIDNAWEVACTGDECEVSQCCETFCAFYACPGPFIPIDDARNVRCTDDVCTTEQCCESVSH